jgi:hypothetical protein
MEVLDLDIPFPAEVLCGFEPLRYQMSGGEIKQLFLLDIFTPDKPVIKQPRPPAIYRIDWDVDRFVGQ